MKRSTIKQISYLVGFGAFLLLSSCSNGRSASGGRLVYVDATTTSSSVTTTTTQACIPNPSVNGYPTGPITLGTSTIIRFVGWGLCNNRFKVSGLPGVSLDSRLDIVDIFNQRAGDQIREYTIQLVDGAGNPVGATFPVVVNVMVDAPSTTTTTMVGATTTTTTLQAVQLPTCTLERVISRTHPPTSNGQRSIWVRFQVEGTNVTSRLNGQTVGSGVYEVRTNNFPFFDLEGEVTNSVGSARCQLNVATSYCVHSVVGSPTPTSVTTELTTIGRVSNIFIQGIRQSLPESIWIFPGVAYTESFASSTLARVRESSGLVESDSGDFWSCPVSYTVPAASPPRPPSFMNLGDYLVAGDSLVPSGANICGCRAVMQADGNFVVYRGTRALWNSQTWRYAGSYFTLQTDGNMVIYQNGTARWSSGTRNKGSWQLHMQGDCNLVLYSYNFQSALWSSRSHQAGCY